MAVEKRSSRIANYILQLLAIGLAVLFGIYTALSYIVSKESLQQTQIANQLSLISFCTSDTSVSPAFFASRSYEPATTYKVIITAIN
jgi:hypothetical protein